MGDSPSSSSTLKPVLVGMNNPYSSRPEAALLPAPSGCAGWRLWRMVHDVSGVSRAEYCRTFDRRNLINTQWWDPLAARERGEALWRALEGHTVVVLGQATLASMWLPRPLELLWSVSGGVRWCYAPHPSGLNRWYNNPVNRAAVGMRLESLLEEYRRASAEACAWPSESVGCNGEV